MIVAQGKIFHGKIPSKDKVKFMIHNFDLQNLYKFDEKLANRDLNELNISQNRVRISIPVK